MRTHLFLSCSIILAVLAAVNAIDPPAVNAPEGDVPLTRYEFREPHMGTEFRIVLYAPSEAIAKQAARAAFDRVAELNKILSDYLADSEVMRLCRRPNEWVAVSDDLFEVLSKSAEMAKRSDGAFDVTVGPMTRLWRRSRRTLEMPTAAAIAAARQVVGHAFIELDPATKSVRLRRDGMIIDLGGIAKGYAADAALEVLRRHGVRRALVAASGDIVVGDAPPDAAGWIVSIDDPIPIDPPTRVTLANAAVSTSGDANQYVTIDGTRYSHIVDPRTGLGVTGRRAATVVAPTGVEADALATIMTIVGPDRGFEIVESEPGRSGRFVEIANEPRIRESPSFNRLVSSESRIGNRE